MTIGELARMLGRRIVIVWQPTGLALPWQARIDGAEVKDGVTLAGVYGHGITPMEALADYCPQIAGKVLVLDGQRINVPEGLVCG